MNRCYLADLLKHMCFLLLLTYTLSNNGFAQCNADFSFEIDSLNGNVTFTNYSTVDTLTPVFFMWYSSPSVPLSSDTNPVIHFDAGEYDICLKVTSGGCTDSFCTSFTMPPVYCKARFTYSVDQLTGNTSFTNQSEGANLSYYWSFGDGSYSADTSPTHLYTTNGFYFVCLNIMNSDSSCGEFSCDFVQINKSSPTPCSVDFIYQYDTADFRKVNFYNASSSDTGVTYLWLFDYADTSSLENPPHTFDSSGFYTVCLLVSGPNCGDSVCKVVEITDLTPVCQAGFSYELYPDSGSTSTDRIVAFENTSTGTGLSYMWTFGDNQTDTSASPIHYYPVDGLYKVCLTTFNPQTSCFDSACAMIRIETVTGLPASKDFELNNIKLYPVPLTDVLNLELNSLRHTTADIAVYDLLGKTRYKQQRKIQPGPNQIEMNTAGLDKGLYFLEIHSGEQSRTMRIVK